MQSASMDLRLKRRAIERKALFLHQDAALIQTVNHQAQTPVKHSDQLQRAIPIATEFLNGV